LTARLAGLNSSVIVVSLRPQSVLPSYLLPYYLYQLNDERSVLHLAFILFHDPYLNRMIRYIKVNARGEPS